MSNSLKNDLILLKELQDLDLQIGYAKQKIDEINDSHNFLKRRIESCGFILSEIERLNVENKISFENINNLVKDQRFCFEEFLSEEDGVAVCVSKIEQLKRKFEEKFAENDEVVKTTTAEEEKLIENLTAKRKNVVSILQPNFLKTYDRLFNTFDDKVVVALLEDNTCTHCHVKCCMQKTVDVLKFENLVFCENCGRILSVE